jgi:excisionase family DNA binding protein
LLGIGRNKLRELIDEGEIDAIRIGNTALVVMTSLKAFVLRQRGLVPEPTIRIRDLAKIYAEPRASSVDPIV